MSSPTVSLQNSGLTAQTAAAATVVSIPDAPAEMRELPAGSILPAVFIPAKTVSEMPVIQMTLPDGKELAVPVKSTHMLRVPTPVSIKILPFDAKKAMTVRVHFSAPLPDIKKAIKDLPEALQSQDATASSVQKHSIPLRAFVLRSVPEQITALMNEMESPVEQNLPPLKPEQTVRLEISPQSNQTINALTEHTRLPAVQTTDQSTFPNSPPNTVPEISETKPDSLPSFSANTSVSTPESSDISSFPVKESAPASVVQSIPRQDIPSSFPAENQEAQTSVISPKTEPASPSFSVPRENPPETVSRASALPTQTPPALSLEKNEPFIKDHPLPLPAEPAPEQNSSPTSSSAEKTTQILPSPFPLKGVVFDFKERSAPLVITKIGVLALEEKIQLPHLTPVNVQITEIAEPPAFSLTEHTDNPVFRGIEETLNLLRDTDSASFESFKNALPQIGNKLPAQIISFINTASRNVPVSSFIGESSVAVLQSLGEKGHSLLTQIEKEITASPKKVTDGRSSWKGWTVPFLSGAIVEPVSLYLQKPHENGHRQKGTVSKPNAVRFVLDLNLTRLGNLQMDGLAHRSERRFDLIIRHQNDLPDAFDEKIRFIFTQTLSALNYTGTVKVDHTDQFIILTQELETESKRGVWA